MSVAEIARSRPPNPELNVMDLLQELGIVANESMSITTTLYMSLDAIGRHTGWPLGRVVGRGNHRLDGEVEILWYDRAVFGANPCSGGWPTVAAARRAAEAGKPVIIEDITVGDDQSSAAGNCDTQLRGYLAYPIQVGNAWAAVMEFYSLHPLHLSPELHQVLNHAVALLGLVLERGMAQSSLRESERRFRAIFDQSYQLICLLEPDGTLIEANETALQFAGIALEDVVGRKFWDTPWWQHSPNAQEELKMAVARAARGELLHYEAEVQGLGGLVATMDFSIKPIRNLYGDIVLLIPEARDITELRHTLESLRLAEARLEEAQYVAQMGHWEYDIVGQQSFWSDTLYPVFGLDVAAVTDPGQEFMARIHPDDVDEVRASLERAYTLRRSYSHTYRIIWPDGGVRSVFGAGNVVLNESGEVIRITGIIQDITSRRELEQSLARSVEQLSSLNAIGQVVASARDLEHIYRQVLAGARSMLNVDVLALLIHDQGQLHIVAHDHDERLDIGQWSMPVDGGVAGNVWLMGRPVWLTGEECRQRRSEKFAKLAGMEPGAILAIPVRWQEEMLGVLEAVDERAEAFSEGDLETLQAVGTWLAIAIGRARQHGELERRVRESEAIARISRALSETLEPQVILEMIAASAHDIVPSTDWAVIHLLRGRPERLYPVASAGSAPPAEDYIIGAGEGIAGRVLLEGHVLNIGDVQLDGRATPFARSVGMRSLLVAPIQSRSRTLGTISIMEKEPYAFTADDERLLTIMAAQAGMAIENAQLFDSQRRARTVAELQRERLRELTKRIVTAQEEERLRISRELHDEAGQALTSLKISLDLLRTSLAPDQQALATRLADIAGLADMTMETLRTLAHDLRPPGLDTFGLNVALEGLCYDLSARTAIPVAYEGADLPELPTELALSMYRLVQEALTNTAKHANARDVRVSLAREDGWLTLTVADDGQGFLLEADNSEPRQRGGIGLVSMNERTQLLGGTLTIETAPGSGTRLTARVPFDIAADKEQNGGMGKLPRGEQR